MTDDKLLTTGISGSGIAAVCCFTPALVILLGAVGLSAWLAWIDYVLFPILALFLGITVYAWMRRRRAAKPATLLDKNNPAGCNR